MYKILIIDDDWSERKISYEYLFNKSEGFDLAFLENIKDMPLIDDPTIDAIVLDLYLNYGKEETERSKVENYLREVLKYIKNKKPVILVSRKFSELASWVNIPKDYGVAVIDYFGWPEIFTASGKIKDKSLKDTTLLRINNSLNKYFGLTNSKKGSDENISILLLSDLQFGDPKFSDDTLLSEFYLSNYLGNEEIFPDFIFILGDISYTGEPSQFKLASEWIESFCKRVFPHDFEAYYERVYIVPGNHDVNLTLSTADYYKFDFKGYESKEYLKKRDRTLSENKTFGLYPFCDFAYKMTKDDRWISKTNNLCWSNDRFINWGLRFIILNSVSELSYDTPKLFEVNEESLKNLSKEIDNFPKDLFTILLAHNGPDDLGYQMGLNSDKRVKSLFSIINTVGGNLFIHGHRHSPSDKYKRPYQGEFTDNIEYILTGTLNINVARKHDSLRSFSVLELERENYKVIDSNIRIFEIQEQGIREKK